MTRGKTMIWSKNNKIAIELLLTCKKNLNKADKLNTICKSYTYINTYTIQLPELHKCPELMEFTKLQHQQERQVYDDYQ